MLSTAVSALLVSSAAVASAQDFWWSYPPDNNYTVPAYDPMFEICGTSCSDCRENATQCYSSEFTNICYEPQAAETCCQDIYGTACGEGYYCAYNPSEVAYCCESGTSVDDCGKVVEDSLSTAVGGAEATRVITVTPTAAFQPTSTGATQVDRPNRTPAPKIPGFNANSNNNNNNGTKTEESGLSTGDKIGIAVGAVGGVGLLAAAVAFFIAHRRHKKQPKYNAMGGVGGVGGHNPANQMLMPPQFGGAPVPMHAPSAYEPMKHAQEQQQPLMMGTAVAPGPAMSPFHDTHAVPDRSVSPQPSLYSVPPMYQDSPSGAISPPKGGMPYVAGGMAMQTPPPPPVPAFVELPDRGSEPQELSGQAAARK
ncbi:hypothetical protein EJ04DRAFT_514714 [Polyplosphaeria fusca]|uniref:Uncharacterized protein n=1 Tax=Polyplosphaeria fusca TaxID=682080 RepID=A0A9P4QPI9_9PLEO|nr:hypothetical protein EJ04DRAFT_514714 [Polyplosphaeria fusca]